MGVQEPGWTPPEGGLLCLCQMTAATWCWNSGVFFTATSWVSVTTAIWIGSKMEDHAISHGLPATSAMEAVPQAVHEGITQVCNCVLQKPPVARNIRKFLVIHNEIWLTAGAYFK